MLVFPHFAATCNGVILCYEKVIRLFMKSEVFTAVVIKIVVLLNVISCGLP